MKCSLLVAVAASVVLASVAAAQPLPDGNESEGTEHPPNIPVTIGRPEVLDSERSGVTSAPAAVPLEHPIDPEAYVCGPGDVLELNFWGRQNFRLRMTVDLEGRTFVSKVGYISVSGNTLAKVRTDIKKKVRTVYPGLTYDLTLVRPRSFLVHVVENVKSPGTYTTNALERVSQVVMRAGITGSRRRIAIRHGNGRETLADLTRYELTGDTKYNPFVLDGDIIKVPFRETTVTVDGAVRRAGTYELVDSKDLRELFDLAGGFTTGLLKSMPVRITRRDKHDRAQFIELAFQNGTAPNAPLHDGDVVVVHGADELQRFVLLIGAVAGSDPVDAASKSKRLPFVEGDTVRTLIERAGGIRAEGDLHRAYVSRPRKNSTPEIIPIDLDALLIKRDFTADLGVQLGDTVVIPPMQYSVLVEGAVARAGLYPYNPKFGIPEYIAHAGGRTRTARDLNEVKLIDANGKTHGFRSNLTLSPGDAILVPERNFTRPEIVQLIIAGAGLLLSGVALTFAITR